MRNLPSLDGLRACAVALVFVAHAGFGHRVPGGFGVTLFFVLSGYLITGLLLAEHESFGRIDLPRFYLRRALRLLPPLFAVIAVTGLLAAAGVSAGQFTPLGLAAATFHFGNYHLIFNDFSGMPAGLGVLWSLAVEEHFYLLFPPWLALMLARHHRRQLARRVLIACLVILGWRLWLQHRGVSEAWLTMATDTRADAILAGCLLALVVDPFGGQARPWPTARAAVLLATAALLLLATLLWRDEAFRLGWRYSLQAVAVLPLLHFAVTHAEWPIFRWLQSTPMAWIGQRSYGIYLVHHVILEGIARHWPEATSAALLVAGVALTLPVAALLHATIEAPCSRLRRRLQATGQEIPSPVPAPTDISLCIATFRRPTKLGRLLEDLAGQSQQPTEVVVVDNDAAQTARAVLDRFRARGYPCRLVYAVEPQQNISLARNRCVALATGRWLAFVDDDERAPAEWLQRLAACAGTAAADGVLGPVIPVLPEGTAKWLGNGTLHDWPRMRTGTVVPANRLRFGNVLLSRSWLTVQPEPFDPALGLTGGEDGDLLGRLRQQGARLVWCDEAWVQEPVDPSRLRLRWLWLRAMRGGQDHARHLLRGRYGTKGPLGRAAYFMRALLQVLFAAAIALLVMGAMPHQGVRWLLRVSANLGKLSVLGGLHHREYAEPRA